MTYWEPIKQWFSFKGSVVKFNSTENHASRNAFTNLVPRAHVPFGQHQDKELWNNQFLETKILGLPASRRMRGLV